MPENKEEQDAPGLPWQQEDSEQEKPGTEAPQDNSDDSEHSGDSENDSEKLISQKELDRIVQKRLKRQEDQLLKKYADYDTIKADAEAFQKMQGEKATDAERWERREKELLASLSERDEKLTVLERTTLVADLATDAKLPKKLWQYVQGANTDEIEESITSIKNDFELDGEVGGEKPNKTPKTRKPGSVYGGGGENESPDPDTDAIVSKIPRGPQLRIDKPRTYR